MQMLYQMQQKYNNPIFSGNINDIKVTNEQTILKKLKSQISTKLQQRHSKIPSTSNSKRNSNSDNNENAEIHWPKKRTKGLQISGADRNEHRSNDFYRTNNANSVVMQ